MPSTPRGLWRQRVRWTRGLIQTLRLHHDMLFTGRYGLLGWYLPLNLVMMLVLPVLQLAALVVVLATLLASASPLALAFVGGFTLASLAVTLLEILLAVGLNRAWHDLRYLYVLPMVPFFSVFMSLVTFAALVLEVRRAPARWNKLARTGVVSRTV